MWVFFCFLFWCVYLKNVLNYSLITFSHFWVLFVTECDFKHNNRQMMLKRWCHLTTVTSPATAPHQLKSAGGVSLLQYFARVCCQIVTQSSHSLTDTLISWEQVSKTLSSCVLSWRVLRQSQLYVVHMTHYLLLSILCADDGHPWWETTLGPCPEGCRCWCEAWNKQHQNTLQSQWRLSPEDTVLWEKAPLSVSHRVVRSLQL